jgi:hypothetical protein
VQHITHLPCGAVVDQIVANHIMGASHATGRAVRYGLPYTGRALCGEARHWAVAPAPTHTPSCRPGRATGSLASHLMGVQVMGGRRPFRRQSLLVSARTVRQAIVWGASLWEAASRALWQSLTTSARAREATVGGGGPS